MYCTYNVEPTEQLRYISSRRRHDATDRRPSRQQGQGLRSGLAGRKPTLAAASWFRFACFGVFRAGGPTPLASASRLQAMRRSRCETGMHRQGVIVDLAQEAHLSGSGQPERQAKEKRCRRRRERPASEKVKKQKQHQRATNSTPYFLGRSLLHLPATAP
jgi:hypothetical protein